MHLHGCLRLSLRHHAHRPLAKRLMHMMHLSVVVSKSSSDWLNYTGFLGDVCVAFFSVPAGNKDAKPPNERRKPSCLQMWRWTLDFQKYLKYLKICGIESLKYIREFHTSVWYCGDISMPRHVALNETNCDWLFDMHVKRPHGWALANECGLRPSIPDLQPSEGLATRG